MNGTTQPRLTHCLIENCLDTEHVKGHYLVPLAVQGIDDLVGQLEWLWNMKLNTLNFKTPKNKFYACPSLLTRFEKNQILLLPEHEIVQQYMNSLNVLPWRECTANRDTFPRIPESKEYNYLLLPLNRRPMQMYKGPKYKHKPGDMTEPPFRRMADITSRHPQAISLSERPPRPTDFFDYRFIKVKSHIHPTFAIIQSGRTIAEMTPMSAVSQIFCQYGSTIGDVWRVYLAWTRYYEEKDASSDESVGETSDSLCEEDELELEATSTCSRPPPLFSPWSNEKIQAWVKSVSDYRP